MSLESLILYTRFRISAHNLHVASGRYRNVKNEEGFCKVRKTNIIEDDFHFFPNVVCIMIYENNILIQSSKTHKI